MSSQPLKEMPLSFRKVALNEEQAVQAMYRRIIDHLGETEGSSRWHALDYPKPQYIAAWLEAGDLYGAITKDGTIAGAVALDHSAVPGHELIPWQVEAKDADVLIMHVLGVDPAYLRRGVATFLVEEAKQVGRRRGCKALRLETFRDNVAAHNLYVRSSLTHLGVHPLGYEGADFKDFHVFETEL